MDKCRVVVQSLHMLDWMDIPFVFIYPIYIIFQKELHIILNHIYGRDVEYLEKTNLAPYLATSPVGSDRQARQSSPSDDAVAIRVSARFPHPMCREVSRPLAIVLPARARGDRRGDADASNVGTSTPVQALHLPIVSCLTSACRDTREEKQWPAAPHLAAAAATRTPSPLPTRRRPSDLRVTRYSAAAEWRKLLGTRRRVRPLPSHNKRNKRARLHEVLHQYPIVTFAGDHAHTELALLSFNINEVNSSSFFRPCSFPLSQPRNNSRPKLLVYLYIYIYIYNKISSAGMNPGVILTALNDRGALNWLRIPFDLMWICSGLVVSSMNAFAVNL